MFTVPSRKRPRSSYSSSPEDPSPFSPNGESTSLKRDSSASISPTGSRPDSDFESLPAHLVNEAPSRKRRRKEKGVEGNGITNSSHGKPAPFIRTGFESMALESDGEDAYLAAGGCVTQQPEVHEFGEQQEEFVDDFPSVTSKDFAFQPNGNSAFYDTYHTQDASIPDIRGHLPIVDNMRVVQPASVEMPSPDQEIPSFIRKQPAARAPYGREAAEVTVEEDMDPEAGGIPQSKTKGKSWYEPEKDRIVVTSLSDTESETSSPGPSTPPIDLSTTTDEIIEIPSAEKLSQPGSRGFTIHPTFLNQLGRMSEAERSRLPFLPSRHRSTQERGLVLYRTPEQIFRGARKSNAMESDDEDDATADRFQVLPDDYDDADMMVEEDGDVDVVPMSDIEVDGSGITEEVDSMEIG
ncbi:hypothetical protein QFC22_000481 [Naganishia vaughanmartiniae]|uniref:Uncharacterized protein n=1 Tax=Naganishia vaughanmartiniae TaxID=1424756 RepID=A0ACC2XQ87_9TREE|nr:hypothetical protein QFC22_000481 [Naganishia vaughanmartiniae]